MLLTFNTSTTFSASLLTEGNCSAIGAEMQKTGSVCFVELVFYSGFSKSNLAKFTK